MSAITVNPSNFFGCGTISLGDQTLSYIDHSKILGRIIGAIQRICAIIGLFSSWDPLKFKAESNSYISLKRGDLENSINFSTEKKGTEAMLKNSYTMEFSFAHFVHLAKYGGPSKVSKEGIRMAPLPLSVPEDLDFIDSSSIVQRYRNFCRNHGRVILREKVEALGYLCNPKSNEASDKPLVYKEFIGYLKGILCKLEQGNVTADTEDRILTQLIEARSACIGTWAKTAERMYGLIHGDTDSAKQRLLRYVQQFKEEIILSLGQGQQNENKTEWHVVNWVSKYHGEELGFKANFKNDNFIEACGAVTDWKSFKDQFLKKYYDRDALITSVQASIMMNTYSSSYFDLLKESAFELGITDPSGVFYDITPDGYDWVLNKLGVETLLNKIGILKKPYSQKNLINKLL